MADLQPVTGIRSLLGEGPVWDAAAQALYWVDIRRPAVYRLDPGRASVATWMMPEPVGSLALRQRGGLLVALRSALAFFDPESGLVETAAQPDDHPEAHRFNDGKCDRRGRFWSGTMQDREPSPPAGGLFRLDPDRRCRRVLDRIAIPNALAWSPDDRTMYFADSPHRAILAFPFDADDGHLGKPQLFAEVAPPGFPDGATVDAEGFLWNAEYGGGRVTRYTPDGRVDRVIELPASQPTSCAFGGPALNILYITTAAQGLAPEDLARQPLAGALLALDPGVRGLPEPRFAG